MGFFKDFKRDFAQAVNELMPDKDELDNEYDDEDMVDTLDEDIEIDPEDLLDDDLDYIKVSDIDNNDLSSKELVNEDKMQDDEMQYEEELDYDGELVVQEDQTTEDHIKNNHKKVDISNELFSDQFGELDKSDELVELDNLDQVNMLEGIYETNLVEQEVNKASIEEAVEATIKKTINIDKPESTKEFEERLQEEKEEQIKEQTEEQIEEQSSEEDEQKTNETISYKDEFVDNLHNKKEEVVDTSKEKKEVYMSAIEGEIKKSSDELTSIMTEDTTYITKGTKICGNLFTDGSLDVIGVIEGDVDCQSKLIVGGEIKGNVSAGEIYSNASKIEGEVVARGSVKIGVGSVIVGSVSATSAVIAGAINGDIDVQGPVIVDSTAVIMGNIKSRSVQINNGAVIEGFCSQCYSEIDVKSFFA